MSAIIKIHDREYILYGNGENIGRSKYPHMVDRATGLIPAGDQRSMMKEWLLQHNIDIEPWEERDTHWCIRQAIYFMNNGTPRKTRIRTGSKEKTNSVKSHSKNKVAKNVNSTDIESIHAIVEGANAYGEESKLIRNFFRRYPPNEDLEIVAAKIAMVDLAYSTHLSTHKSKISLMELAKIIVAIPGIDMRMEQGDPHLVEKIARCNGKINLFSFASKYCTCHNVEVYGRDDYSIYDDVVANALPIYLSGLRKMQIEKWRKSFNYSAYNLCIGEILDNNHVHIHFRRRKFDHYLWYLNRKSEKSELEDDE